VALSSRGGFGSVRQAAMAVDNSPGNALTVSTCVPQAGGGLSNSALFGGMDATSAPAAPATGGAVLGSWTGGSPAAVPAC